MEKNVVNQKVNENQDFEEFLKSRKISDIFARPDPHIRDNINYLTDLKKHYPIVLNFIQFVQNLYKNDPDSSVNFREINSFLTANNEIINSLNPYWGNYDTSKILKGLCESGSISKIGKHNYKITESLSNDISANVNKILDDEKIRGIFRRKIPPTFKEIHGIIDSHVNQYYELKEKWQPIDSYKILKYYEKNLEGFIVKKKLSEKRSVKVNRRKVFAGKHFPIGDGDVLIKVDKNFVYCYPSINLKEGIQHAPVIYDRKTWYRIQHYRVISSRRDGLQYLTLEKNDLTLGIHFPNQNGETAIVRIDKKENEVKIFPDLGAKEQPVIFKKKTTLSYKKIQYYVLIKKNGTYRYASGNYNKLGLEYKKKKMAMNIGNPLCIKFYPEQDIDKPGIVFNRINGRKIQFYQDLEENGGFVYEDKIYSFPEHGGKEVLIKVDEIENQILCFPHCNLEEESLVIPINESEVIQFYKKNPYRNKIWYKGKYYSLRNDFPSTNVAVTVNESENRIYIYPDQDLSKPPQILDLLTGKRIQIYKKFQSGHFELNDVKYDIYNEYIMRDLKDKLAIVRIDYENNEVIVTLVGTKNPFIFNKTTGKKK